MVAYGGCFEVGDFRMLRVINVVSVDAWMDCKKSVLR